MPDTFKILYMHLYVIVNSELQDLDLLRTRIGDVLRQERRIQGKSLKQLAESANLSPSHLSDIERGEKEASSEVLRSVYRSLGMNLDDLLTRATNPPNTELYLAS